MSVDPAIYRADLLAKLAAVEKQIESYRATLALFEIERGRGQVPVERLREDGAEDGYMSSKPERRMKLHAANWLAQTTHLDGVQYMALHQLLSHACMRGELPSERERLARIARCTIEEFERAWPEIEGWFEVAPDGRITAPDPCFARGERRRGRRA